MATPARKNPKIKGEAKNEYEYAWKYFQTIDESNKDKGMKLFDGLLLRQQEMRAGN